MASHLGAFVAGDLEAVLADYAEDAVVLTQDGTHRGRGEIAGLFEGLLAEFSDPDATLFLDEQLVEGEYGYVVWHGETPAAEYEFATDTFVVRDGEIVAQTFAGKVTPRE